MARKKNISQDFLIEKYMNFILKNGTKPSSIFLFSEDLNIDESTFYNHFNSFEQLEKEIYAILFKKTIETLNKSEYFPTYNAKEKLLSLYFTFIENLTSNRSFVLLTINKKTPIEGLSTLKRLKNEFIIFIKTLDIDTIDLKQKNLAKIQEKSMDEFLWIQFLIIIKFWLNDASKSFEKTDIFIEKTVHASFDLMNTQPVQSFLDLGKFLLKEKMNFKM